jgi:Growth-Arrest-Specific Protein 2 Domain
MWGSKKVLVKIINGRLIIRVGGGFMSVEEFVQ